jgi:NAD(P)-dependent dehydrogenase (short-subunit alcohol dehydrogenase family)
MNSELMIRGKVVVVTGAGSGIGREVALAMARNGARVVVNDVGASLSGDSLGLNPGQEVVREIKEFGGEAVANSDSVADAEGARHIIECALDSFGRIDSVVNNAGILRDRIFHKMSIDEWDSVLKVHLYGTFYTSRAAAPYLKEQESGSFVHMTSASGLVGNLGQANYSAAKLGIVSLSKSIALDMEKFNVRSNCVAPFAWGRMTDSIPSDTPEEKLRVERLKQMSANKIAPMVVYLVSDAAKKVNGQVFAVRNNEIMLMSQPRPIRSVHRSEGWTVESIANHAMPALAESFYSLDRSADIFSWDPI